MGDIQPVTLDFGHFMQLGLQREQMKEQQRHNAAIEQHQSAQTQAYTAAHDTQSLLSIVNSKNLPIPTKYMAVHRLMQINQQRNGMKFDSQPKLDPLEYTKNPALFDSLVSTVFAKGPQAPESQAMLQQAMQSPDYPLFQDSVQQVMKEAHMKSVQQGMQSLASQALGKPASPDEADAVTSSEQLQSKIGGKVFQSSLENELSQAVHQQTAELDAQEGALIQGQKHLITYADPSFDLHSELSYVSQLAPNQKMTKATQALMGSNASDELARQTGTLTSEERQSMKAQLSTDLQTLGDKRRALQQEMRASQYDMGGDIPSRHVSQIQQELQGVQAGLQLKQAEQAYLSNPSHDTLARLQTTYGQLDQLMQGNKQQITALRDQKLALLQGSSNEKAQEFKVTQAYQQNVAKAQQDYTQGTMTPANAGILAKKYGVKVSDVLDAGKDVNKPLTEVNVSSEKKYSEAFGSKMAEADVAMRDQAQKAPDLSERADRVMSVLAQGKAITGFAADFRLNFAKAMKVAGLSDSDSPAVTETLATDLAANTLDAIKASGLGGGTGFSNADRDFLEKAKGGKIVLEPGTLDRLARLSKRAAEKSVDRWNARYKQIPKSAIEGTGIQPEPTLSRKAPASGEVRDGYRFKGGDPSKPQSWEKVN
jgi:hypothetical protein